MGQEAKPTQGTFSLEAGGNVIGESDDLISGTQYELTRVQNKGFAGINLNQASQVWLVKRGVDVLILVVVKKPEETVQPDINAGGLNHSQIEGV